MRKKIYEIIEPNKETLANDIYSIFMFICIIVSMIPLMDKRPSEVYNIINIVTVTVFIIDYILRLFTADLRYGKGIKSFIKYPFTAMAIIDLISILPSLAPINNGFKVLRLLRLSRPLMVFRSFKIFRYSKNLDRIIAVLKKETKPLLAVMSMAIFYVMFTALVMFNIEPDTFDSFFDAIYWSVISLTGIGYGDIYPLSDIGRLFTIISAIVGVAIIALPSGIITAGYMETLNEEKNNK